MTLKPDQWKPGMTIWAQRYGEPYHLCVLVRHGTDIDGDIGWVAMSAKGMEVFAIDDVSIDEARRPATYADLSREPVEWERAVCVNSEACHEEVGETFTYGSCENLNGGLPCFFREANVWFCGHKVDQFAPLTPVPDAERDAFGHALTNALNDHFAGNERKGVLTRPTTLAECDVDLQFPCYTVYLKDRARCDPCQPCALLIDLADYWCAWYAEHGDRCRTCGFRSCSGCES